MVVNHSLTPKEEELVLELKKAVASIVKDDPALEAFCTKHTYVRYLRARGWSLPRATQMLSDTLQWRRETRPERLMWSDVERGAATGKMYLLDDPDKAGRPVVVMVPRNENLFGDVDMQLKYLVYTLEKASQRADNLGAGKMTWLVDFVGYTMKNAPPMSVTKSTVNIVQNHYPERLGEAICYHAPRVFEVTWKAIRPFIDPVTKKKVTFVRKQRNGLLARTTTGSFSTEGESEVAVADDDQLASKFDVMLLDESLGGQAKAPYSAAKYGEVMMREDLDRDAALAKLMISSGENEAPPTNVHA